MGYEILFNFISPVTGRILCDTNNVLVGDANGIAIPMPFIPIGLLPDLPMGNIWIGNDMNRPIPNPTISINNLPNLSSGKVWVGNGLMPSRPIESDPPQGPPGPPGSPGIPDTDPSNLISSLTGDAISSLVKLGLEKLLTSATDGLGKAFLAIYGAGLVINSAVDIANTVIDGIAVNKDHRTSYLDYRTTNIENNSLIGSRGAEGLSVRPTLIMYSNLSIKGGRLEDLAPSPLADYDAVCAKWVWDLLNDNVEIKWS